MATSDLERMLDDWAIAWSSNDSNDPERVLALFADDCVFEDVTFGVVARGKTEFDMDARIPRLRAAHDAGMNGHRILIVDDELAEITAIATDDSPGVVPALLVPRSSSVGTLQNDKPV